MFWLGVLIGFVFCLILAVIGVLILVYVFPERPSESTVRFIRKREQEIRDKRTLSSIRRRWPQLNGSEVHWLLHLARLDGKTFEELIATVYSRQGGQVTRCGKPGDQGIDLIVSEDNEVVCIQCKCWNPVSSIPENVIRDLLAAIQIGPASKGILISTAPLSRPARTLVSRLTEIETIVGPEIIALMDEAGLLPLDDEGWNALVGETTSEFKSLPALVRYPLFVQATFHNQTVEAELLSASGRTLYDGKTYASPSAAGRAASGWKSCNGWTFWHYRHPETGEWRVIDALRDK